MMIFVNHLEILIFQVFTNIPSSPTPNSSRTGWRTSHQHHHPLQLSNSLLVNKHPICHPIEKTSKNIQPHPTHHIPPHPSNPSYHSPSKHLGAFHPPNGSYMQSAVRRHATQRGEILGLLPFEEDLVFSQKEFQVAEIPRNLQQDPLNGPLSLSI